MKVAGADLVLKHNADETYVFFHEQPEGAEELAIAHEALAVCPQNAIGNDGA